MRVDRKVQAAGIEVTTTGAIFGGPRLFAPETTVVSAMDDDFMDGKEQVGQGDRSTGEGNGHENPRIIVVGDEAGDAAREGGSTEQGGTNDPKRQERSDRRSSSGPGQRQVQSPSSCTIFIGGKPVAANDIPTTSPNIFCGRQPRSRGEVRTGRAWWVGTRGEDELGRRLKSSLVGVFHRGAMWASPSLVEASLQVRVNVTRSPQNLPPCSFLDFVMEIKFTLKQQCIARSSKRPVSAAYVRRGCTRPWDKRFTPYRATAWPLEMSSSGSFRL